MATVLSPLEFFGLLTVKTVYYLHIKTFISVISSEGILKNVNIARAPLVSGDTRERFVTSYSLHSWISLDYYTLGKSHFCLQNPGQGLNIV